MKSKKIENLKRAFANLELAAGTPVRESRDLGGIIKAFEIVFELSWKILQQKNTEQGVPSSGPRDTLEKAFEIGPISEDTVWVEALKDKNLTVHTYDEAFANEMILRIINKYIPIFKNLIASQC